MRQDTVPMPVVETGSEQSPASRCARTTAPPKAGALRRQQLVDEGFGLKAAMKAPPEGGANSSRSSCRVTWGNSALCER